jgi:hypothetical protein
MLLSVAEVSHREAQNLAAGYCVAAPIRQRTDRGSNVISDFDTEPTRDRIGRMAKFARYRSLSADIITSSWEGQEFVQAVREWEAGRRKEAT